MAPSAKSSRSRFWFVRLDGAEEFLRQKWESAGTWIDVKAVLAVYHVGSTKENPHCHAVLELSSEPQKQSIAKRFKELFGIEKRSQYAIAVWDGIRDAGASSYMFHEESAKIICSKGWDDGEIQAARQSCEAVQKVVALNKERASTKLVDKAVEYFDGKDPGKHDVLRFMLQECRDGNSYYPGSFLLKKYVEEALLKLTDKSNFESFVMDMARQMWRD